MLIADLMRDLKCFEKCHDRGLKRRRKQAILIECKLRVYSRLMLKNRREIEFEEKEYSTSMQVPSQD